MAYLLLEIGRWSVCFIIKGIMFYSLALVCVVCYVSAKHIACMWFSEKTCNPQSAQSSRGLARCTSVNRASACLCM